MLTYRVARSMLAHKPPVFRLRPAQLHTFGLVHPTRIFQPMRFQEYSTDENRSENGSENAFKKVSENKSEMQDLANRGTKLETSFDTAIDDRINKLVNRLQESWDKSLEKSLQPINDAIRDTRAWMRWLLGIVVTGIDKVALKFVFYDRHVEEKFTKRQDEMEARLMKKQDRMEARLTTMIQNVITRLRLELMVEAQERLLSAGNMKK
ncbi:hypothetical protein C7212DRAFT_366547 [Tuber magnatum]|uniref:Uncharacterized protein n=1 Tax=Tuber magnatum TaxID=42249 RepID=A0A317SF13_9PEZI|nr:hypothetical protein C7212DRAFT_366547 [Tuber magnatum]